MKNIISVLLVVIAVGLAFVLADSAFPTAGERAARDARAAARAASAQAWAAQADERAGAVTVALWGGVGVVLLTLAGVGAAVVRLVVIRSASLAPHREHGLYPAVLQGGEWRVLNEPGAQTMAALPARPTAGVARALLGQGTALTATGRGGDAPRIIDATVEAARFDGAVDLVSRPHTILLGRTGSGKSTAGYAIAEAIRRRYPAEFVIAEPGGVSWGSQCQAADVREIANVLGEAEQEMRRRQAMLVAEDVQHITQLGNPPPFLVLLLEELEDVLDSLRLVGQGEAQRARVALRNIAREGRKPGVCLLGITQFGKSDVVDSHVRHNMGALFLFQNSANVGEMLRLPPGVRLDKLSVGTAYAFHSGRMVSFPKVERPMLPARSSVPAVPVPARNATPSPIYEQERERRWDDFLADAIANGNPKSPSHLARLMAIKDGRPDEYESYKSIAWRYLHP
jgi:hypothetical protein